MHSGSLCWINPSFDLKVDDPDRTVIQYRLFHGQACERKQAGHHPNCEGICSTLSFAVARKGRTPWLEMNTRQGNVKVRLVA